jgi:hypothetical protein
MAFGDFTVARTSVKYVLNASGVLASVAANTPAFGFNADGTYRGLLVEPGATNLFTYSQDFNNAAWTKTATITSNSDVAPDGTTTADTFTDGTGAFLDFRQAVTIVTATTYTVSVFIEKTVGALTHYPGIGVSLGGGTELGYAIFNTTTGATATDGVVGLTVSSRSFEYPDYWRFEFTFLGTETSALFLFYPALSSNGTTINSAATGSNVFWGAQLETGSVATSYIPTVASTATRTADSVSLTGASSLIGQTEGTLYVEHQPILSTGLVSRQVIGVSDNTFDNMRDWYIKHLVRLLDTDLCQPLDRVQAIYMNLQKATQVVLLREMWKKLRLHIKTQTTQPIEMALPLLVRSQVRERLQA